MIFVKCLKVAENVLQDEYPELNKGQTHYHTHAVHPYWADSDEMTKINSENTTLRMGPVHCVEKLNFLSNDFGALRSSRIVPLID